MLSAQDCPIITITPLQGTPWSPLCDEIPFRVTIGNNCGSDLTNLRFAITFPSNSISVDPTNSGFPIAMGTAGFRTRFDSETFSLGNLEERTLDFWLRGENCDITGNYRIQVGIVDIQTGIAQIEEEQLWQDPFSSCRLAEGSLNQLIDDGEFPDFSSCNSGAGGLNPRAFLVPNEFIVDYDGLFCFSDQNVQNPNNRIINMQDGAIIRVLNGAHLRIEDFEIRGCTRLWQSIIVEDGGRLTLQNCTIRDGIQAVQVEPGGHATLKGNDFRDNFVSLDMRDNDPTQDPTPTAIIRQNVFQGVETLLPPFENQRSSVGITAINIPDLNLAGFSVGGNIFSNVFRNMRGGIRCINSNLSINRAVFEDIQPQNGQGGEAIRSQGGINHRNVIVTRAEFDNCRTGISSDRNVLNINDNTMTEMGDGITIENAVNMLQFMFDNDIQASDHGIRYTGIEPGFLMIFDNNITMNNPTDAENSFAFRGELINVNNIFPSYVIENNRIVLEDARFGVFVSDGSDIRVEDNAISTAFGSDLLQRYDYIFLDGTQSPVLSCNDIIGNAEGDNYRDARGITLNGTAFGVLECNGITETEVGIDVNDMSMDTRLSGNRMGRHQTGLQLRQNANIGQQDYNGNQWTLLNYLDDPNPNDDLLGARHLGGIQAQEQSLFVVDNSIDEEFMPSRPTTNAFWFNPDNEEPNFICPVAGCGFSRNGFIANEDDKLKKNIMKNELATNGFGAALRYAGARQLYRGLQMSNAQINTGGLFDSFLTTESTTSVGHFYTLENEVSSLFEVDSLVQDSLLQYWETIVDNTEAIWLKDSLINETTDSTEIQQLTSDKIALKLELEQADFNAQTIYNQLETDRLAAIPQVLSNNQAISATAVYETNQKTVTNILLETRAAGVEPNDVQLANLHSIANQCPLAGGEAVYQARAMVQGGYYDDEALCAAASGNSHMKEEEVEPNFSIYPNPSDGRFSLLLPANIKSITISNTMGQVIQRWDDMVFESNWQVQNVNLPSGTYYCTVKTSSTTKTQAFVIIK